MEIGCSSIFYYLFEVHRPKTNLRNISYVIAHHFHFNGVKISKKLYRITSIFEHYLLCKLYMCNVIFSHFIDAFRFKNKFVASYVLSNALIFFSLEIRTIEPVFLFSILRKHYQQFCGKKKFFLVPNICDASICLSIGSLFHCSVCLRFSHIIHA